MDNRLNDIRRKISDLRTEMLALEASIRSQVNRDLDCSEQASKLMAMRSQVIRLIAERNALGGGESCPGITERLLENYRPVRKGLARKGLGDLSPT
jgi:hypothetical protein